MRRFYSLLLVFILIVGYNVPVFAYDRTVAEYIYLSTENPGVGMIGGDWAVFGLARSEYDVQSSFYENYYNNVVKYVKENNGVLDSQKHTEYSRVILALTAAGYNPCDVGGYDLTVPLGDFEKTIRQGINGAVYALLALDCKDYEIPVNSNASVQATRDMYITEILSRQLPDGGFALNKSASKADVEITGMVLQSLAKYRDRAEVDDAIRRGLECISKMLKDAGIEGAEKIAQVIVALCELGIGVDKPEFTKDGATLVDKLLEYYVPGEGFKSDGVVNQMAAEQALYALAAVYRYENGLPSLYNMAHNEMPGLPGKHSDIRSLPVTAYYKTFYDIVSHVNKTEIEALALRGIISGKSDVYFDPYSTMTRSEFATIITRGLGLEQDSTIVFEDVNPESWYFGYVGSAYKYGIVSGVSEKAFNPYGLITLEEAAVMLAKAAELCGINSGSVNNNVEFVSGLEISEWALKPLLFCYSEGFITNIYPKESVKRGEIAGMLYRLLKKAALI